MHGSHADPEFIVGVLAIMAITGFALYRLFRWIREAPYSPDPWGTEITKSLEESDAVPVCLRCFAPQPPNQWFCEHCGSAVGDCNNWMPYVKVFSEGEVFRNGTTGRIRVNVLTVGGYLLLPLCTYIVFAPVYWYFFFRNVSRIRHEQIHQSPSEATGGSSTAS